MSSQIRSIVAALFITAAPLYAQDEAKFVMAITVDQMRAEYLERFEPHFTGGFARLLQNGMVYRNAHYTHVPTYTAPGHATIFTGAEPSDHGIIGNNWYDPTDGNAYYCVEDTNYRTVGQEKDAAYGRIAPTNLRTTTITDELHLSSAGRSYIGAVSIKDRGAVLPGGHRADEVYWLGGSGQFITSTYYTDSLPAWVQNFHERHADLAEYAQVWNPMLPIHEYRHAYPDESEFETPQNGTTSLPRDIPSTMDATSLGSFKTSPDGNRYLTDFALDLIDNIPQELLDDEFADFVSVSYSSTDYIGHAHGPRSVEVMDAYLRLDQDLTRLFNALDERLGERNYLVVLTADHGVAENPNFLREELGMQAKNHSAADMNVVLREACVERLGYDPIRAFFNDAVFFNDSILTHHQANPTEVETLLAEVFAESPSIQKAWSYSELITSSKRSAIIRANTMDERHADIYIQWADGNYIYGRNGASHGSGYTYDTHVPCIMMGPSIQAGDVYRKTAVIDIAPTLSFLLGNSLPHSAYGQPLLECLPFVD